MAWAAVALAAAAFVGYSGDAFALGTPSSGPSGTVGPPGKSSVPAPFGALFLGFGTTIAAWLKARLKGSVHIPGIVLILSLVAASLVGATSVQTAFLLSVPAWALCLSRPRRVRWDLESALLLSVIAPILATALALPFVPIFGGLLCLWLFFFTSERPGALVLSTATIFAVASLHQLSALIDPVVQEAFTVGTVGLLNLMGFQASAMGNTIVGLNTTIAVTPICVGMAIIANLTALAAFVSALFVPSKSQLSVFSAMVTVGLLLNFIRIVSISAVGELFVAWNIDSVHDALGWLLAIATYTAMAWLAARSRRTEMAA